MLEGRPGEDSGRRPALRTPGSQTPAPGTVRNESGLRPPGSWAATKGELCPLGPGRQDAGLCGPCSPSDARPGKAEGRGLRLVLPPGPLSPTRCETHMCSHRTPLSPPGLSLLTWATGRCDEKAAQEGVMLGQGHEEAAAHEPLPSRALDTHDVFKTRLHPGQRNQVEAGTSAKPWRRRGAGRSGSFGAGGGEGHGWSRNIKMRKPAEPQGVYPDAHDSLEMCNYSNSPMKKSG